MSGLTVKLIVRVSFLDKSATLPPISLVTSAICCVRRPNSRLYVYQISLAVDSVRILFDCLRHLYKLLVNFVRVNS